MKIETLIGIATTARAMDITASLRDEGLMFELSKGRHKVSSMVLWTTLDTASDPHGVCACTMGDIFNAMKVAQGVDRMRPNVINGPGYWTGSGRAGNGSDI